jgi:hypothetical protein
MKSKFLMLCLAMVVAISAFAQSSSLTGTVTDPSGKVIPNASIRLTSESTGETRSLTTDENGDFVFSALVAGAYTVHVEATGFRPLDRKGNNVLSASRLALGNLQMDVGAVAESVSVTAQGAGVATTTTAQDAHLDSNQVAMISIRGRDAMSLLRLMPGVQQGVDTDTFGGSFATAVPAVMGQTGRQTIYVDGINGGDGGNGGGGGGNFSAATNIDAIAEVNVQLNNYTAEYGLKGGPQINLVTKHGGNTFHGTGYWYKRHEMFNATNFFNNSVGQIKPVYRYSTLGGNLGGPVKLKIPVINPGGNKFFFFYSVDDTRLKDANQLRRYTMPTALERAGDFSQTRTTAGALVTVRDPLTGQPFPNNVIPTNRANQFGLAILNILPTPNQNLPVTAGYNYLTQEPSIAHPRRQQIWKWDLRPTDRDTISIKYQTFWTKSVGWEVAGRSAPWGLVRQRYDFTSDDGKIDYTKIISPRMVNEFAIGIHYTTEGGPPEDQKALQGMQRQFRGLSGLPQIAPQNNPLNIIPKATFGTLQNNSPTGLGQSDTPNIAYDNRWPITGADTAFPISDTLTYTRGSHTFKAGVLREHERFGQARSSTFAGEFNFSNDGNDPTNAGFAYANAYLGHITTYTESMGRVPDNFYQSTWSWYAQDTWRVKKNLTLDIGLRMYKWGIPAWGGGEASAFTFDRFDPKWGGKPPVLYQPTTVTAGRRALNPLTGEVLPVSFVGLMVPGTGYSCGPITPKTPCAINGIVTQNDPTYTSAGKGFIEPFNLFFDPRFGVAWDPMGDGKMAIRASFGVFHQGTGGPAIQGGGPAYRFDQVIRYTDMNSYFTGVGPTAPGSIGSTTGAGGYWKNGQKQPLTYNYTFAIQKDLGWHTVLDVAYVGNTTHHQTRIQNMNMLAQGVKFLPSSRDNTVTASAANPGALPDNFLRPIVGYGDIWIGGPGYSSRYDSLQVQANRRFARGFELGGAYTWASSTSNVGIGTGSSATDTVTYFRLSPTSNRSKNPLVQSHILNLSYVIDIPGGSRLIHGAVSRAILDNWQVSGVSTFATGLPSNVTFTTTDTFDFSGGGEVCGTGIVQTGNAVLGRDQRNVNQWFNTSVFARPSGRGDLGNNCYNGKFTLPGFNNHDLSVFKNFKIKEKSTLQFRAEAYNAFNHTQFNAVATAAQFDPTGKQTQANFGKVTSAKNERRMQFSLRFSF